MKLETYEFEGRYNRERGVKIFNEKHPGAQIIQIVQEISSIMAGSGAISYKYVIFFTDPTKP